MAYRDNVSALAALCGISNDPALKESDLGIGGFYFYHRNSTLFTRFISVKMNKGARLFFEHHALSLRGTKRRVISGEDFQTLHIVAAEYFAELWNDVENRPLLATFKEADAVLIFWKSTPNWLEDFNSGCE